MQTYLMGDLLLSTTFTFRSSSLSLVISSGSSSLLLSVLVLQVIYSKVSTLVILTLQYVHSPQETQIHDQTPVLCSRHSCDNHIVTVRVRDMPVRVQIKKKNTFPTTLQSYVIPTQQVLTISIASSLSARPLRHLRYLHYQSLLHQPSCIERNSTGIYLLLHRD